ncbi:MAG: LOG family protein, partial [Undibacterium sp.]|nr:LOG family protein [Undibacterium sp.]
QLGFHEKPLGLLNVNGFYDSLILFLKQTVQKHFLKQEHLNLLIIESDPDRLLQRLNEFTPPHLNKWLNKDDI